MASITSCSNTDAGVTVIVPVLNGARWLSDVLTAIRAECQGRPHEIVVVDDGSRDGSAGVARRTGGVRVVAGPGRGAAAAVNAGLAVARYPLIAQIDQDVIVRRGWLAALTEAMRDPQVAAAQGWYVADRAAPVLARVMALDLEQRYARITGGLTDHVCTGNVLWRRDALRRVGGLDETLGYGYDNDLSYRLVEAGYRLLIRRDAPSTHCWRDGWPGYAAQQYGFGYGRLDLIARHRSRLLGDRVSPAAMMLHPAILAVSLGAAGVAVISWTVTRGGTWWALSSVALIGLLVGERTAAGIAAALRWRDPAALLFPVVHLARDLAWVVAAARWAARRLTRTPAAPAHSMTPRAPAPLTAAPGSVEPR